MKKGFTLVELIGVIVLIALIGSIAIIPINKMLKDSKDKMYDKQIGQIVLAAQNWASDHQVDLLEDIKNVSDYTNPVRIITLDDLINDDYLESNIKDLKDEKNIIMGCSKIEIYFTEASINSDNKSYRYKFVRLQTC